MDAYVKNMKKWTLEYVMTHRKGRLFNNRSNWQYERLSDIITQNERFSGCKKRSTESASSISSWKISLLSQEITMSKISPNYRLKHAQKCMKCGYETTFCFSMSLDERLILEISCQEKRLISCIMGLRK